MPGTVTGEENGGGGWEGYGAVSNEPLHPAPYTLFPAPLHHAHCTPLPTEPCTPHPLPQYPVSHTSYCTLKHTLCVLHPCTPALCILHPTPIEPSTPHCTMYLTPCSLCPVTYDLLCGPRYTSSPCTLCPCNPVPLGLHPAPCALHLAALL